MQGGCGVVGVPKSVIRFDKNGVKYISSVERCQYTIRELTRAALRDVGKFIIRECNKKALKLMGGGLAKTNRIIKHKGAGKNKDLAFEYWARKKECDLQVGIRHDTWYGVEQELGSSKMKKHGILRNTTYENVPEIIKIESQYLSALENEARALELIAEREYSSKTDG